MLERPRISQDFSTISALKQRRCLEIYRTFKKLLKKKKLRKIVIDLDSRADDVEGNQEGAVKGYNLGYKGNNCYNILMAFCDELKAYITGFMRSGNNTYTSNGAAEMIKEIIANLRDEVDNIVFYNGQRL